MSTVRTSTPDQHSKGLLASPPDALRYDQMPFGANEDPLEVPGILQNWMPSWVRVLDVGCATGSMTLRINRGKNNQVIGLEPDEERATLARSRGLNVVSGILDESFVKS